MSAKRVAMMILVFLTTFTAAYADGVTVRASAPASVSVGQRFQLSFVVNDKAKEIILPDIEAFDVLMGPSTSTSQSYSLTNGKMESSSQTIYTYVLKATQKGSFTLPAAQVTVGDETIQSNRVTIHVVSGDDSSAASESSSSTSSSSSSSTKVSGEGDLFITQSLSRSSVYEGEGTQLVTKVYTRVNLNSLTDKKDPKLAEFVVSDMSPQSITFHDEVVNGMQYSVAELDRKVIIPQKSGKITIEPMEVEFVVKKRVSRGGGGFFDSFFDDVQMSKQRVRSKSVTLNVKPLPSGKPVGFSGGVGTFKFDVSVSPTDVEVDNSVTVRVSVEGEGNLKLLSLPKPQFHQDFDTFDPSQKSNIEPTAEGFKGKRTDEYLIIPRRDGQFEIPQISFSYFDTSKGKYVTLNKGPFTINVQKGEGKNAGQGGGVVFQGAGPEQVQYTNSDLRYLHRTKSLSPRGDFFLFSGLFWLCVLVPIVVLVVLFFVYRQRVFENANAGLVKSRKANKAAKKRLKKAATFIKENKREAFYDEVMRALWGYLSDKLTLPLSELTKDNAKEKMLEHNASPDDADAFLSLLDECEFARYAPAASTASLEDVYQRAADVIGKIENSTIKK